MVEKSSTTQWGQMMNTEPLTQMDPGDTDGPGGHKEVAVMTVQGGIGVPEG